MHDQQHQVVKNRGAFGMSTPQRRSIERIGNLIADTMMLTTLALGRERSSRRRADTVLDAMVRGRPARVVLHRWEIAAGL
jgi:hypothetical protein